MFKFAVCWYDNTLHNLPQIHFIEAPSIGEALLIFFLKGEFMFGEFSTVSIEKYYQQEVWPSLKTLSKADLPEFLLGMAEEGSLINIKEIK